MIATQFCVYHIVLEVKFNVKLIYYSAIYQPKSKHRNNHVINNLSMDYMI